ncbi:MAG: DUF1353 domain-containing protein [Opitutaceae bacterium]
MFRRDGQQFDGELVLTPLADGKRWKVHDAFSYETDGGAVIEIQAGFVTDLASVPRFLWPLFPPFGRYIRAAVIHDALYDRHRRHVGHYSRAYADAVLLEAMADDHVQRWQRRCIWLGVRLGGFVAWNANP